MCSVGYEGQQKPSAEVWFPTVTEPIEDFWAKIYLISALGLCLQEKLMCMMIVLARCIEGPPTFLSFFTDDENCAIL